MMERSEMTVVLGLAAAYDNRLVDESMVEAWYDAIGDHDFDAAREGIRAHYRGETGWLMPAHITRYVEAQAVQQRVQAERDRAAAEVLERRREREEWLIYKAEQELAQTAVADALGGME